jgi:hypothetical protein
MEPEEQAKPEVTELPTGLQLMVTETQVEELFALDATERRDALGALLGIEDAGHNFRSEVVLDFHFYNLQHAVSLCLSAKKTAVFMSIMHQVLESMSLPSPTSPTQGEPYTCPDCFREYKRLILSHSVDKPPASMALFVSSEVRLLTDFVNLTIMKHFHLYQYCLLFAREVDTVRAEVSLEEPSPAPSLFNAKLREDPTEPGLGSSWAQAIPSGPELHVAGDDKENEDDYLDRLVDNNLKAEVRDLIEKKMEQLSSQLQERLDDRERDLQARVAALTTGAKP